MELIAFCLAFSLCGMAFLLILAWHERRYAREREEWKQERARK